LDIDWIGHHRNMGEISKGKHMILIDMLKSFDEANNRFWKFVGDALGITPDEPPIVSDHPPIHSVDGQMHLGEAITKGEQ